MSWSITEKVGVLIIRNGGEKWPTIELLVEERPVRDYIEVPEHVCGCFQ